MEKMSEDLDAASKKLMEEKGFLIKNKFARFILEQNTGMAYLQGLITAFCLFILIFQQNFWPFLAWVIFSVCFSLFRAIYWSIQVKRSEIEINKIEGDLQNLNKEIKKSKDYFEGLRNKAKRK